MTKPTPRSTWVGGKVVRDTTTMNQVKVHLGDAASAFVRPIRAGNKVVRSPAAQDQGKVRLGDNAPTFAQ
jgi:hypothetical protein